MSSVKAIPEGYHSIQPYLYVRGAAQAMEFYRKAFGATEIMRMPGPDGRIQHAEMRFGDSVVMLADEAPEKNVYSPLHFGGATSSLLLYVERCDAAYRQAIAAGGKSLREPADQPYGDRMSGVEDPFGFQWWIATHVKDMPVDEMKGATPGENAS